MVRPGLSIVVPLHNEEAIVETLVQRLKTVMDGLGVNTEVILVNDGSRDRTAEVLRQARGADQRFKVIHLSRNFGHQRAITAGLDYADGDACIIMDGDLQDPPELIPDLLTRWREGYEVVHAVRSERRGETFIKKLTAKWFYRILQAMTDVPIAKDSGDFRLMDRKVVQALRRIQERSRFLRGLVNWVGYRQTSVSYPREARMAGETKFSMRRMIRFATDAITSFSIIPLQMATTFGLVVSATAFVYAVSVLYDHFVTGRTVAGWTSLMIVVLFFGGIQMIFLGVLGEYLGRVFEEVKQRPLYLIASLEGFPEEGNRSSSNN